MAHERTAAAERSRAWREVASGENYDAARGLLRCFRKGRQSIEVIKLWGEGKPSAPWAVKFTSSHPVWKHYLPTDIDLADADFNSEDPRTAGKGLSRLLIPSDLEEFKRLFLPVPRLPIGVWKARWARKLAAQAVPKRIRDAITSHYSSRHHFQMLSFCARHPGALSLIGSNPALALTIALGNRRGIKQKPVRRRWRSIRGLARKPLRAALAWLDLPATSQTRKILAHTTTKDLEFSDLASLRDLLWDENVARRLARLPRVTARLIRYLKVPDFADHSGDRLLFEVADYRGRGPDPHDTMRDTLAMARVAGGELPVCADMAALKFHHDMLAATGRVSQEQRLRALRMPDPGVKGMEDGPDFIRLLETGADIIEHGRRLSCCIPIMVVEVFAAAGRKSLWAVRVGDEDATLRVVRDEKGVPRIARRDLTGKRNDDVSPRLLRAVVCWAEREGIICALPEG